MAAHILTALKETKEEYQQGRFDTLMFTFALDRAAWGNQLDYDWYLKFREAIRANNVQAVYDLVDRLIPFYETIWNALGRPRTYEEWILRDTDYAHTLIHKMLTSYQELESTMEMK